MIAPFSHEANDFFFQGMLSLESSASIKEHFRETVTRIKTKQQRKKKKKHDNICLSNFSRQPNPHPRSLFFESKPASASPARPPPPSLPPPPLTATCSVKYCHLLVPHSKEFPNGMAHTHAHTQVGAWGHGHLVMIRFKYCKKK